jgi:ring-1,2-phenylacetyl-CoA epoxidase subunit PaaD
MGGESAQRVREGSDPVSRLEHARAALEGVTDPELPFLSIADIGILRDVRLAGETLEVAITPTYSGCPAMDVIALDIVAVLAKAGLPNARIVRVLSPAWTTDWLSRALCRGRGPLPFVRLDGDRARQRVRLHPLQGALPLPRLS